MSQQGGREGEPDVEGRTLASLLAAFLKFKVISRGVFFVSLKPWPFSTCVRSCHQHYLPSPPVFSVWAPVCILLMLSLTGFEPNQQGDKSM